MQYQIHYAGSITGMWSAVVLLTNLWGSEYRDNRELACLVRADAPDCKCSFGVCARLVWPDGVEPPCLQAMAVPHS